MGRDSYVITDTTPLTTGTIDIPARIGWLLRTSREAQGLTLQDVSRALPTKPTGGGRQSRHGNVSVPTLSAVERSGRRVGRFINGYEDALGLTPGRLRAAVDVICRTFPHSPPDRDPWAQDLTPLEGFSAAARAVEADPTGGQWLSFALHHDLTDFGVPLHLMQPAVDRLIEELPRSVGVAYSTRYEALSRLRCGAYGELVKARIQMNLTHQPDVWAINDLFSALTERPDPDLLRWCAGQLVHASPAIAQGAALGLHNIRTIASFGPEVWEPVGDVFPRALEAARSEAALDSLGRLFKILPTRIRQSLEGQGARPQGSVRGPSSWRAGDQNEHLALCDRMSRRLTDTIGLRPEPQLGRLLFELLYDFRAAYTVTSAFLLSASPVAEPLYDELLALALNAPDETTLRGARAAFGPLMGDLGSMRSDERVDQLIRADAEVGLRVAAQAGFHAPASTLEGVVATPRLHEPLVSYLGMSRHPLLTDVTFSSTLGEGATRAIERWRRTCGRLTK